MYVLHIAQHNTLRWIRIPAAEDSCRRSHLACQHQAPNSTASTVIKHCGSLKSDTQAALHALHQTRFAHPHHLAQLLLGSLGRDFLLRDGRVSKLGRLEGAEVCHGRDSEDGLKARRRVDASWCDDHDTLAGLAVTDAEQSPGCFTLGALNLSAQFKQVRADLPLWHPSQASWRRPCQRPGRSGRVSMCIWVKDMC